MALPQQLPSLEFNPRDRFFPATTTLFEQPVSFPRVTWRSLLALAITFTELIDVSKWQLPSTIDYAALAAGGVAGLAMKATEGVSIMDAQFTPHWQNGKNEGMYGMPYHFFRSNQGGIPQADYFWNAIQPLISALGYVPPLWVDVETVDGVTSNSTRLARLQACLVRLDELAGPGRAGVYSSPGFANASLSPAPSWINNYWHWVAHWTSASRPTQPTGWSSDKCPLWQYGVWNDHSWCAPVPGCQPDIDRDKFFGGVVALAAFVGASAPLSLDERVTVLEEEARAHGWEV